jgi:organic hydroperoxide reductase OsmC/OhrA
MSKHHYKVRTQWTGASKGATESENYSRDCVVSIQGKADVLGSSDPSFKGDPTRHNPEDMLLSALSMCHMLSYLALASRKGLKVIGYEDNAEGEMVVEAGKPGKFVSATLKPTVILEAGQDAELARALHEKAHAICFIANSLNFPVSMDITVRLG